ncbi:SHO1 [Candida theae]|uniref:High osmolarity signaling protein SHO1 n=1 Tax=Candida theae TaxID=1198502 RepID=A0AAD5BB27_9ASCO|nr:SHO1 [Candida theae]KAI5949028.1 SHO1 [Candida theae]
MGFRISNFTGDPFAVSTISFGFVAWIVSLGGAAASDQSNFPHFSWWGIAYQIVIIFIILLLYLNNNIELYKFTLVGLVSIAFIYTTNSTNNLIYNSTSSGNLCCAAGCILSSILNLIWIMYFGGHPESPTNQFIDSFSYRSHSHEQLGRSPALKDSYEDDVGHTQEFKRFGSSTQLPLTTTSRRASNPASSSHNMLHETRGLSFEPAGSTLRNNSQTMSSGVAAATTPNQVGTYNSSNGTRDLLGSKPSPVFNDSSNGTGTTAGTNTNSGTGTGTGTGTGITFRYKAKALYSYDANPDDINEISFVKDEILEVDDIDGKWWQARRVNGQVGICPSNYVKLINN